MPLTPPIVLTIAGFDPSSGAGVTADIKTIAAHECYGLACITALTVQSTLGVSRVVPVDAEIVAETLNELVADMPIAAIRIGMLGSGNAARAVAGFIRQNGPPNVVLDPILKSSSGAKLLDDTGKELLLKELLPLARVVTPNLDEASSLAGLPVTNLEEMKAAAGCLHLMGAHAVVITGGHLDDPTDLLSVATSDGISIQPFTSAKQHTASTHGTGCAFATSLTCHLALGAEIPEAVQRANSYVHQSIRNAYPVGRGIGPVNHLWNLKQVSG